MLAFGAVKEDVQIRLKKFLRPPFTRHGNRTSRVLGSSTLRAIRSQRLRALGSQRLGVIRSQRLV
jgi:hypothetical protein